MTLTARRRKEMEEKKKKKRNENKEEEEEEERRNRTGKKRKRRGMRRRKMRRRAREEIWRRGWQCILLLRVPPCGYCPCIRYYPHINKLRYSSLFLKDAGCVLWRLM
uniref:Uncharacterized protein n=1 Tax=Cacopsylla melanoneura TaxID=428564 RepID=A0A8D8SHR3_9HEMI